MDNAKHVNSSDVIIGDYSVVAMGSVVTKSIPPMVLAGGVPCRPLKDLSEDLKKELEEIENMISSYPSEKKWDTPIRNIKLI